MRTAPSRMRVYNDRTALDLMAGHGPMSRATLEQLTGLSKPGVAELLNRLERVALIERAGKRTGGPGPSAQLWSIRAAAGHAAAVDVRKGEVSVVLCDLVGEELVRIEQQFDGRHPTDAVVDALAQARHAAGLADELTAVVVGVPGGIEPLTGRLLYTRRIPEWAGIDLVGHLRERIAGDVVVENDVNLIALAEQGSAAATVATDGGEAPTPDDSFALVWIDAVGLGAALVLDGELHHGVTGGAGEIDYIPFADAGAPEGATLGAALSDHGILELARIHGCPVEAGAEGRVVIAQAAASADTASTAFLTDVARRAAFAATVVHSVMDPRTTVLGGSVVAAGGEMLRGLIQARIEQIQTPDRMTPLNLRVQRYGPDAVLVGGLRLALHNAQATVFASGSVIDG
ncbi:MAG: ROK family transcriptional regulator [Actinobacteria bacterium]|nr:ROK family transcriptional regulator [Actinomycetota bacterium]